MPSAGGLRFLRQRGREEVAAQVAPVGLVNPALVRVPYEVVVAVSPLGYSGGLLPPHLFVVAWNRPIRRSRKTEARARNGRGGGSVGWVASAAASRATPASAAGRAARRGQATVYVHRRQEGKGGGRGSKGVRHRRAIFTRTDSATIQQ